VSTRYLALFGLLLFASCSEPKPLEIFGTVPPFRLTAQDGSTFDSTALLGHVWVADFIFTNCEGPCPRMSGKMETLQRESPPTLRLVSFSVDPARDTPPVLTKYAQQFHADPRRWTFLTGEQSELNQLGTTAFHLQSVDGTLVHSTRFALIDQRGRIRGYYGIGSDDPVGHLIADAARLTRELS
jgi:protein SCO1/2